MVDWRNDRYMVALVAGASIRLDGGCAFGLQLGLGSTKAKETAISLHFSKVCPSDPRLPCAIPPALLYALNATIACVASCCCVAEQRSRISCTLAHQSSETVLQTMYTSANTICKSWGVSQDRIQPNPGCRDVGSSTTGSSGSSSRVETRMPCRSARAATCFSDGNDFGIRSSGFVALQAPTVNLLSEGDCNNGPGQTLLTYLSWQWFLPHQAPKCPSSPLKVQPLHIP